jgi:hypothetical protein
MSTASDFESPGLSLQTDAPIAASVEVDTGLSLSKDPDTVGDADGDNSVVLDWFCVG